jgi:hypothetical protein
LEKLSSKAAEIKQIQENPPIKVEEVAPSSVSDTTQGPTIEEVKEEEKQPMEEETEEATVEEVPSENMEEDFFHIENPKEEVPVETQIEEEASPVETQVEDITPEKKKEEVVEEAAEQPNIPEVPPTVEYPEDKAMLKIKVVAEGVDNLKKVKYSSLQYLIFSGH